MQTVSNVALNHGFKSNFRAQNQQNQAYRIQSQPIKDVVSFSGQMVPAKSFIARQANNLAEIFGEKFQLYKATDGANIFLANGDFTAKQISKFENQILSSYKKESKELAKFQGEADIKEFIPELFKFSEKFGQDGHPKDVLEIQSREASFDSGLYKLLVKTKAKDEGVKIALNYFDFCDNFGDSISRSMKTFLHSLKKPTIVSKEYTINRMDRDVQYGGIDYYGVYISKVNPTKVNHID